MKPLLDQKRRGEFPRKRVKIKYPPYAGLDANHSWPNGALAKRDWPIQALTGGARHKTAVMMKAVNWAWPPSPCKAELSSPMLMQNSKALAKKTNAQMN